MADDLTAPEQIWAEPSQYPEEWTATANQITEFDVQYVRADLYEALERERDELATKLDAVTSGDWSKAKLVRFENGQFDFSGGPVAFIAEYLSQVMEADEGYHNNLEVKVSHQKAGPMVLTLQRVWGETPAEQRKKAIARAEAAEAALATARAAITKAISDACVDEFSDEREKGIVAGLAEALALIDGGRK